MKQDNTFSDRIYTQFLHQFLLMLMLLQTCMIMEHKKDILKDVSTVLVHAVKVNGVQK